MENNKSLVSSIAHMNCPNCRKGHMFTNRSVFPLKKMLDMPEYCPNCGQKMEIEVGFYYGTGYVSYAICVAFCIFNFLWYYFLIGINISDNSIFQYLAVNILIIVLLQPWIMRYSRVLYLNMFVRYNQNKYIHEAFKSEHKDSK